MDAQQLKALFGDKVRFWTGAMSVEEAAVKQLQNISELPILAGHIAVMPDVHMGKGATVGSVIPTLSAVIPSSVGVDIGCGMQAVRTGLTAADLPDSLAAVRAAIEAAVPMGFAYHDKDLSIGHEALRPPFSSIVTIACWLVSMTWLCSPASAILTGYGCVASSAPEAGATTSSSSVWMNRNEFG